MAALILPLFTLHAVLVIWNSIDLARNESQLCRCSNLSRNALSHPHLLALAFCIITSLLSLAHHIRLCFPAGMSDEPHLAQIKVQTKMNHLHTCLYKHRTEHTAIHQVLRNQTSLLCAASTAGAAPVLTENMCRCRRAWTTCTPKASYMVT